jgi:hypothetical protein
MVWMTLLGIGIKPEKGLELMSLIQHQRGIRSKVFTTCLPVSEVTQGIEKSWSDEALERGCSGLGEERGKLGESKKRPMMRGDFWRFGRIESILKC